MASPEQVATTTGTLEDLTGAMEALVTYQPVGDARPTVNALLDGIARWLEGGGDLAELETALDNATTQNQIPISVTEQDVTGDGHEDVVVHIPVMGLPLLVFLDQGDAYVSYALPPDFAETLVNSWPVDPGLTLWGTPQSPLEVTDLTGDGAPEILLTYLFPGGSGFHLQPIVFQWHAGAFRPIFAAHLINWAGEAGLALEPDPTGSGGRQIVLRYPYLYGDGFDHKMVNHPLGQQIWRWDGDTGRFVRAEAAVDLERSGWSSDAPLNGGDRLRWFTNEGERAFRRGEYDQALDWYNHVLRLAAEEEWTPGEDEPNWAKYTAFRRAAVLLLRGQPDEDPPTGYAMDGLAAMQAIADQHQDDVLGKLADAFLEGYGDGSGGDAAARGVATMQRVDLYTYFYESGDQAGVLQFPLDAPGILYPGAGLAAYLNANPNMVDDPEALRTGLADAGFAVEDVKRAEDEVIHITLRLPDAPNVEDQPMEWTLVRGASGWHVAGGDDPYASSETLVLDRSAEWPVVGDFQMAPVVSAQPTSTPPALPTESPEIQIEPLATAARVSFLSWSPDGETIAYLEHSPKDLAVLPPLPPGTLKFLNPATGRVCDSNLILPEGDYLRASKITWTPDGELLVNTNDQSVRGKPCTEFSPVSGPAMAAAEVPDPSVSPDGAHRAQTEVRARSDGILELTTTLTDLRTGQVENSVEWRIDERLGDLGLGGSWLTEDLFLIYETLDQGPLLLTAGQGVSEAALELFGLMDIPNMLGPEGVNLSARGAAVSGTQTYHLVLGGVGVEENFPALRLYHSETGQVEELPFTHTGWPVFSPDGRWLVMDALPIKEGYESSELWLRPLDPVGSEARRLASGNSSRWIWAPNWTLVAGESGGDIVLFSVPDGALIGSWDGGDYNLFPLNWSPGGEWLAVHGYLPNGGEEGLFVLPVKMIPNNE